MIIDIESLAPGEMSRFQCSFVTIVPSLLSSRIWKLPFMTLFLPGLLRKWARKNPSKGCSGSLVAGNFANDLETVIYLPVAKIFVRQFSILAQDVCESDVRAVQRCGRSLDAFLYLEHCMVYSSIVGDDSIEQLAYLLRKRSDK